MEAYKVDSFEKKKKKKQVRIIPPSSEISDHSHHLEKSDNSLSSLNTLSNLSTLNKKNYSDINNDFDKIPTHLATSNEQPKVPFQNKSEIQPFYDEELEQYLNYKEFQQMKEGPLNQQATLSPPVQVPSVTTSIPVQVQQQQQPQPVYSIPPHEHISEKKDMFYKNLVNIGLFIFIGVLIIFLCDQITEIAISIGMKRTVQLLEPYLRNYNT